MQLRSGSVLRSTNSNKMEPKSMQNVVKLGMSSSFGALIYMRLGCQNVSESETVC